MSRDDGFAIADLDTGYMDDAKVHDLWQRLRDPDKMSRALVLHSATVLASWRQGVRISAVQAAPLWLIVDADTLAALRAVRMLDRAGKLPKESWDRWVGPAMQRREVRREAGRTGGLASGHVRSTDAQRLLQQTSTVAEPVRPSVPSIPSGSSVRPTVPGANALKEREKTTPMTTTADILERQFGRAR